MTSLIESSLDLGAVAEAICSSDVVGLDLETTALQPWHGEIRLVQINAAGKIFVIDLFKTKTLGPVKDALASQDVIKVLHNAKFDQKWLLHKYDLELWPIFDTFRASAILYNGRDLHHDLYSVYRRELSVEFHGVDCQKSNWGGILSKDQIEYATFDVSRILELREVLKAKLVEKSLLRIGLIEFGAVLPEASIELSGFYLDKDKWLSLLRKVEAEANALRGDLKRKFPHPTGQLCFGGFESNLNLDSPVQMMKVFDKLGIPVENTSNEALAMVAGEFPILQDFIRYRHLSKKISSFGEKYLTHIDSKTNRIHSDYYPFLKSGRYGCRYPNLTQIPRDPAYRECFRAEEGMRLVLGDFSQIELRFAAEISGDKHLIEAYKRGEDVHRITAAGVCRKKPDDVTKGERQQAKPVNFGFTFGMGPDALIIYAQAGYGVHLTPKQSKDFHKMFFETYPGIKDWHRRAIAEGKRTGIARTPAGRLRYLEGDKFHNEYLNHPVQGGNADGMKAALPLVYKAYKKYGGQAKIIHIVHDEFITKVVDDEELVRDATKTLERCMVEGMQPMLRRVPAVAECSSGYSWADKS